MTKTGPELYYDEFRRQSGMCWCGLGVDEQGPHERWCWRAERWPPVPSPM